jgi:hypothetical protein
MPFPGFRFILTRSRERPFEMGFNLRDVRLQRRVAPRLDRYGRSFETPDCLNSYLLA